MLIRKLETPHLLVFYEAQLALLEQLSQTRAGATHLLDAGLFEAVKESQLFAADPDIGLGNSPSSRFLLIPVH
jgi:nuclear pore complex protein Nup205